MSEHTNPEDLDHIRKPGRAVDVAEAHAALVHLERVTAADIRKGVTESRNWIRANRSVAEAMSHISAWQEIKVRDAVALGKPLPGDVAALLGKER